MIYRYEYVCRYQTELLEKTDLLVERQEEIDEKARELAELQEELDEVQGQHDKFKKL